MNLLITEISRYVMIAALALYVLESFFGVALHKGDIRTGRYIRQYVYILLIHIFGMLTLFVYDTQDKYLIFLFVQMAVLFVVSRAATLIYHGISKMLLNHLQLFLTVGFIIQTRLNFDTAVRQFKIISVALVLFLVVPLIINKVGFLKNLTYLYCGLGIVMLATVMLLGRSTYGAKLSYTILGFTFQPSELVKLLFVFFVASFLYETCGVKKIAISGLISAVFVIVLVLSKDLGSALIFCITYLIMVFAGSGKYRYLSVGVVIGLVAAVLSYKLFSHVQLRVDIWRNPWADVDNKGYQLTQSLFAIATGGWFGSGLTEGTPTTIPFVEEDFVFSAIAEELGSVFGILLILAFLATALLFLKISGRKNEPFYRLIGVGMTTIMGIQVVLTVGGGTRFIPLTGVTLPLISIGGTSALSTILLFGVMAGISLRPEGEEELSEYDEEPLIIYDEDGNEIEIDDDLYFEDVREDDGKKILTSKDPLNAYNDEEPDKGRNKRIVAKRQFILVTAIMFLLLFGGMIFNLSRFLVVEREDVINHSFNVKRQKLMAAKVIRGNIYSQNGEILAETVIDQDGNEVRNYPYANAFAHAVGYAENGRLSVEKEMNMYLSSTSLSLSRRVENNMQGVKDPGNNVYTTFDTRVQKAAVEAMGVYNGAVIVTEIDTGRILCMVSRPDFDPNKITENWDTFVEDENNSVLVNRATQGLYPPGSTFKIITTLEYIRENPENYPNYSFDCKGSFTKDDTTISCYGKHNHGSLNLKDSFARSCNSSFANMGVCLDQKSYANTLLSLYFNGALPTSLLHNESHVTMTGDLSTREMMQTAIGQGETQVSPLHLNMITAAIANDGIMMEPYMVDYVENPIGLKIKTYRPNEIGAIMTPEEASLLQEYMSAVVEYGTGVKLDGYGFTAAGKTGSAEYTKGRDSHAWFTGFAPVDEPKVAITVILEGAGSGGDFAVPVARRVLQKYFETASEM